MNDQGAVQVPDLDSIGIETLGRLELEQLEALAESARRLQTRILEQLEYFSAPHYRQLKRFIFPGGLSFYAESLANGVLINPALPVGFTFRPFLERSTEERERWWLRPYVEIETWSQIERSLRVDHEIRQVRGEVVESLDDLNKRLAERRDSWFRHWPTGSRFEAFCLDDESSDAPSSWGQFPDLEQALACIAERC